jgi:hypothetical protein
MTSNVSLGLSQVSRIAQLCDFLAHPGMQVALGSVPVSMPHDVGSLGFDTPLWVGLGIVGLWSALDAFAERAGIPATKCLACDRSNCLSARLTSTGKLDVAGERADESDTLTPESKACLFHFFPPFLVKYMASARPA